MIRKPQSFFVEVFGKAILIGSVLVFLVGCSRNENSVLRVDSRRISLDEFEQRLNFMPHANQFSSDSVLKLNLAASLVAEKLLALEAIRAHLDTISTIKKRIHEYQKEAVYEEWFKRNIQGQVKISENDLKEAFFRSREKRLVDYDTFSDSLSAFTAYHNASKNNNGLFNNLAQSKIITYGKVWKPVEDVVYGLTIGQISRPIKVGKVYYIFRLRKIISHPLTSTYSFNHLKPSLFKKVKERKEMRLCDRKMLALMKRQRFTIKRNTYNRVLNKLLGIFPFDKSPFLSKYSVSTQEFLKPTFINKKIDSEPFIRFESGEVWTIGQFWEKIKLGPYLRNYRSPQELQRDFKELIRRMVLFETVIKEGYHENLQNTRYVKRQTDMWRDNLLAKIYLQMMAKSIKITDSEMLNYYNLHKKIFAKQEIRKAEIVKVPNKKLSEEFINQFISGKDFARSVKEFSKLFPQKNIGYRVRSFYKRAGNLAKIIYSLSPGQIYGPIQSRNGDFLIVKLVSIKEGKIQSFDKAKSQIRERLLEEKLDKDLNALLVRLAGKHTIRVNRHELMHAKYVKGSMVVLRSNFPYGTAVPSTVPLNSYKKWFRKIVEGHK